MYNYPNIETTLNEICKSRNCTNKIVTTIIEFVDMVTAKNSIIDVFKTYEFDAVCKNIGITVKDTGDVTGYCNALKEIANTSTLSEDKKEEVIKEFAKYFGECSSDEDFCDEKIYVITKNLSSDDSGIDLVDEYDSWEQAEHDVDENYTSCCDDIFMAENMLYEILGWIRERTVDECKNFCSIIEFNAAGLEDAREAWEAENCEPDEEEEYEEDEE